MAESIVAEEWRPVVGWEGHYEVSNLGRLKRVSGFKRKILAQVLHPKGYATYRFVVGDRGQSVKVHRVALEAFFGAAPEGKNECNHKNGIKSDNRIENLEWVSASENTLHKHRVLNIPGSFGHRKLTDGDVVKIREMNLCGWSVGDISGIYGVTKECIGQLIRGKTWSSVH